MYRANSSGIDHEAEKFAGHSYRIEAATTAATCGNAMRELSLHLLH